MVTYMKRAFAGVALWCLAGHVVAGPILEGGIDVPALYGGAAMQGYDFTVLSDGVITALGMWDSSSNGLDGEFQVGLWDTASQTLLGSATIDTGDPLDTSLTVAGGQWRYESLLTNINVFAGTVYTLAFQTNGVRTAQDSLLLNSGSQIAGDNISLGDNRFVAGPSLTFPTGLFSGGLFRGDVNALFKTGSQVPLPATLALLGLGLVGLGFFGRKRT